MIGCASHRFNLACKKYLESSEEVLMEDLEQFQSTTILLQDAKRNLLDVRCIFDEMLKHYPTMDHYLSSDGGILHSPDFENAIVKVLDDDVDNLSSTQVEFLEPFRQENSASVGVGISPVKPDTPYAIQALKKKKERSSPTNSLI